MAASMLSADLTQNEVFSWTIVYVIATFMAACMILALYQTILAIKWKLYLIQKRAKARKVKPVHVEEPIADWLIQSQSEYAENITIEQEKRKKRRLEWMAEIQTPTRVEMPKLAKDEKCKSRNQVAVELTTAVAGTTQETAGDLYLNEMTDDNTLDGNQDWQVKTELLENCIREINKQDQQPKEKPESASSDIDIEAAIQDLIEFSRAPPIAEPR